MRHSVVARTTVLILLISMGVWASTRLWGASPPRHATVQVEDKFLARNVSFSSRIAAGKMVACQVVFQLQYSDGTRDVADSLVDGTIAFVRNMDAVSAELTLSGADFPHGGGKPEFFAVDNVSFEANGFRIIPSAGDCVAARGGQCGLGPQSDIAEFEESLEEKGVLLSFERASESARHHFLLSTTPDPIHNEALWLASHTTYRACLTSIR